MSRSILRFALAIGLLASPAFAATIVFEDVSPDNSNHDPIDPDGASGGRTNGIAIHPTDNSIMYGATEWGGIYRSTDAGLTWGRLDGHLPVATWDVALDPGTPTRVYATSFFDGRTTSVAGINVSTDSGVSWTHPASATPPGGFCGNSLDEAQRAAYGISVDPTVNSTVYIGTSCGLAKSTNSGVSWSYIDPTPGAGSATRIWDVLALGGDVVHVCGDDGHLRSDDGGTSWVAGSGLSSGTCSLAVSPDEPYVLFAVAGTTIFETTNGGDLAGATWAATRTNLSPQGRIPFVATNQRSDAGPDDVFDLWFGDVSLWRVSCTTPASPSPGGAPRCGTGNVPAWSGPFTRAVGGHDDMGSILFDSEAAIDACPVLMSSDGGVYYNTDSTADCHNPDWEQPDVTPHALWPWSVTGSTRAGAEDEDLYFGLQDNGNFGTTMAGADPVPWHEEICCDGFDTGADPAGGLFSICCFGGGGRLTRLFRTDPGFLNGAEINTYPAGGLMPTFDFPDSIVNFGDQNYVMVTRDCAVGVGGCPGADGGIFVTSNIDATPIVWTELGNATEPPTLNICGVYVGLDGAVPTFFAHLGSCNSTTGGDLLYRYTGTDPGGTWTQLFLPSGGFGVVGVDPTDPDLVIASGLTFTDGAMFRSTDSGDTWSAMPELDALMTGGGDFLMRNTRGPSNFTGFSGYWQPSLVGFDPDSDIVVAGGQDSGIFLSSDNGLTWELVSDPLTPHISGTPHLPRPRYAYFDTEPGVGKVVYLGSQGRGIWRMEIQSIFSDGFESGDTSRWQ